MLMIGQIGIDFKTLWNDNGLTIGSQIDILPFFSNHVPIVLNGKRKLYTIYFDYYFPIENQDENTWYNLDETNFYSCLLPKPLRRRVKLWSQVLDLSTEQKSESLINITTIIIW